MIEILAQIEQYVDTPIIIVQWYMIWRLWEILDAQTRNQTRMLMHLLAIRNGGLEDIGDPLESPEWRKIQHRGIDRPP